MYQKQFIRSTSRYCTTWLAPQEREGLNVATNNTKHGVDGKNGEDNILYEWTKILLPLMQRNLDSSVYSLSTVPLALNIRSIKSKVSLMESHVGEEVWDAAKLLCMLLCSLESDVDVKGKRILELGAGCGLLGLCCSILGASKVLCTDYLPEVMNNLAFNLKHNIEHIVDIRKSWIKCAVLDWKDFVGDDIKELDWMLESEIFSTIGEKQYNRTDDDDLYFADKITTYDADIIIGSALIYSPQGGLCCADTVHHFFEKYGVKEVSNYQFLSMRCLEKYKLTFLVSFTQAIILQMTERPGFDRFLLRLEQKEINYKTYEIPEGVYNNAHVSTPREAFKLLRITPKSHSSS